MILLAGVGYPDLRDLSFGPKLVERLREESLPSGICIENMSYGPIAVLHWFEEQTGDFERAIFFGAEECGRRPGTLSTYHWVPESLSSERVQAAVEEAVTGVISLHNLLIISRHFGALPSETSVVELEPEEREWGMELSSSGEKRLEEAVEWVRSELHSGSERVTNGHSQGGAREQ